MYESIQDLVISTYLDSIPKLAQGEIEAHELETLRRLSEAAMRHRSSRIRAIELTSGGVPATEEGPRA